MSSSRVIVDLEFRNLITPLTRDERRELEASLLAEGCRDPLVVWKSNHLLLDGHHRFDICEKHTIPYQVVEVALPDRNSALLWIIRHQLGRRNLSDLQRAELALKLKPMLKTEAYARMMAGKFTPGRNSDEGRTDVLLAQTAGVSKDTLRDAEKVLTSATPELVQAVRDGSVSISAAAEITPLPAQEQQALVQAGPKAVRTRAAVTRMRRKQRRGRHTQPQNLPLEPPRVVLVTPESDPARIAAEIKQKLPPAMVAKLVQALDPDGYRLSGKAYQHLLATADGLLALTPVGSAPAPEVRTMLSFIATLLAPQSAATAPSPEPAEGAV
ncbi:MAG: ParB/RepB/Spo0J family partition protein [Phycisphaerae bacterium]